MSDNRDFDRAVDQWLDDGSDATPPGVIDAVLLAARSMPQERVSPILWRTAPMKRLGYAAAAVAAVAVSIALLGPRFGIGTERPSVDLGIFEPVAGRIVYGDARGIWGVDPAAPPDPATRVQLTSEGGIPMGWSSDGTRLLISRDENLFVLDADGSETQLTEPPATAKRATISPDGSRVVFADGALYAVDADGGPAKLLREAVVADLTFSPDGTQIAYIDWGTGDTGHDVWLMDANGSDAHRIVSSEVVDGHVHGQGLAWSPTGDRIALALEGAIYTFAPDGSGLTRVITGGDQPYWSPDGSQLAYRCVTGTGAEGEKGCGLAIADADGSNVRTFGFGVSGPWHPGPGVDHPTPSVDLVTPDDIAARIVYVASANGEGTFHLLPAGSETRVSTDPIDIRGVTISPDGSRVVFAGGVGAFPGEPTSCCARGFALYAVDADGGPAELLFESRNGFVERPAFAPDGTQIAYVDGVGDNNHHVWVINADGTDAHEIVAKDCACHVDGLAWAPAGDRITLVLEGIEYSFAPDGSDFTRE